MDQDNIFRFDIPMEYLMLVHEVDCLQQVADNIGGALLTQGFPRRDDVVQLPVASQLHYRVEVLLVAEVPVVAYDVGVVQEALDLQLSDELHQ